jgi:hypothetical protein
LSRLSFEEALYALTFLIPPLLELLFGLDFLQVMLGSSCLADLVLFGLLLEQDGCERE